MIFRIAHLYKEQIFDYDDQIFSLSYCYFQRPRIWTLVQIRAPAF